MTRVNIKRFVPAVLLALVTSSSALAANYAIDWYSINSGGGKMSSASYGLNGTLGQSVAGVAGNEKPS